MSGPAVDKELAVVVHEGLRLVGQSEEVKKLREKFIRPSNVDNLQVPKVKPVIWHNISDKGKATDAAVQKAVSKLCWCYQRLLSNLSLLIRIKKLKIKLLCSWRLNNYQLRAVSALSHAVSASCQQRKDVIRAELDNKFHSLCEPTHPGSATPLFGDI